MPTPMPYIAPRRPVVTANGTAMQRHDQRDERERDLPLERDLLRADVEAAVAQPAV